MVDKSVVETKKNSGEHHLFAVLARHAATGVGSSWAFLAALAIVVIWGATGPVFGYSDTWQLVINTGTTIITFLMVFLIQNTQNRDARAVHLKLDELIVAMEAARNQMVDIESLSDTELAALELKFRKLRAECSESEETDENRR